MVYWAYTNKTLRLYEEPIDTITKHPKRITNHTKLITKNPKLITDNPKLITKHPKLIATLVYIIKNVSNKECI